MGLGRSFVAAAVVPALALTACTGGTYGDELVRSGPADPARATLADGHELVISDGGDRYVAQWRERGGEGWTEPQTVAQGSDLETGGSTIVVGGDAAVVAIDWWQADGDEHDSFVRSDAAICHDLTCDLVEDVTAAPMIDADGTFAAVATDDEVPAFAVWRGDDEGWQRVRLTGPPAATGGVHRAPDVRLLADGSLVTVVGRQGADGCTFELWAGRPRRTELAVVAATPARGQDGCYAEDMKAETASVSFYNRAIDQVVTFTRTGDTWIDDQPGGASGEGGLASIDPAVGLPMQITDLDDDSSVAVGSPDLRGIVVQRRPAGSTAWTEPKQVARAPAGQECHAARSETIYGATDVLHLVQCWPAGSAWGDEYDDAPPPTTGVVVASAEGSEWVAQVVERPAYEPLSQTSAHLLVARGGERSLVWRQGAKAFEVVHLPLANPTVDALAVAGDEAIRVTGNPDEDAACVPTWSTAPLTARRWGPSQPIAPIPEWAAGPHDCYGVVIDQEELKRAPKPDRAYRVAAVIEDYNGSIDGVLSRGRGGWRFEGSGD